MKILLVVQSLEGGGAERAVSSLANLFVADGDQVDLVTFADAPDAYSVDARVHRTCLNQRSRSTRPGRAFEIARLVGALRRVVVRSRPDVVLAFVEEVNVLTLVASVATGIPVIVANRAAPDALPLRRDLAVLRRILFPRAAAIVTQTERSAAWYREQGITPLLRVIPNAVDPRVLAEPTGTAPWPWPEDPARVVVLSVGRLTAEKDHATLLRAFRKACDSHVGARLAFVGDGPLREALERQSRSLGLEDRVAWLGWVPDVQSYYAHADIFALPSRYEGFPNALIEAMAHGLACVATDCANGPREIIDRDSTGLLVPVGDDDGLARALDRLLGDENLRVELGERARAASQRFADGAIAASWRGLLDMVRASGRA